MSMQRRHYNAIAAALRSGNASYSLAYNIAVALQSSNPRFDYDKFMHKAISGPTQEQRSAKYRRAILLRAQRAWNVPNAAPFSRDASSVPRPATIPPQSSARLVGSGRLDPT